MEGTGGSAPPKDTKESDLRVLQLIGTDAYEGLVLKGNIPSALSCTSGNMSTSEQRSPDATQYLNCILMDADLLGDSPAQKEERNVIQETPNVIIETPIPKGEE